MLKIALVLVMAALLLGLLLAALHARASASGRRPAWWLGVCHGLVGAAGTAALAYALTYSLTGSERGIRTGVGGFGWIAIALLCAALAVGLGVRSLARRQPDLGELVIILHGTLAVFGAMILAAYVSLG